jgi:hypothetical protein
MGGMRSAVAVHFHNAGGAGFRKSEGLVIGRLARLGDVRMSATHSAAAFHSISRRPARNSFFAI